jgi:2-dehydropantoate 2-reductase
MPPRIESFAVIGVGGIGCAVGYALRSAGARVIFVDADEQKVRWGREHGVAVLGRPPLAAKFRSFDGWTPLDDSIVLLCTKCYSNREVLARLRASVTVIPIQNGFDRTLDTLGSHPEGIASFISECFPGQTRTAITRAGQLHLGQYGAAGAFLSQDIHAVCTRLAALLHNAGLFRVERVADILPYKRTKLMYNAAIGPLAAVAGLDNGQLLALPRMRRLFFALLRENYAILHGAGLPLARIGPFHPQTVNKILRRPWLANALSWAFYPSLRKTYCSMNADLPDGRTEIDYYNGYLVELAGDRPCPLNRALLELVKRMEKSGSPPHPDRLETLMSQYE